MSISKVKHTHRSQIGDVSIAINEYPDADPKAKPPEPRVRGWAYHTGSRGETKGIMGVGFATTEEALKACTEFATGDQS